MRIAYIMRGVPGSGKSTLAKKLAGVNGAIHSTDNYFYIDGRYHFDPPLLQTYHRKNFKTFCESLSNNIPVVVCDNTNKKHADYAPYKEAALAAGYLTAIVTLPHLDSRIAAQRSVHHTPQRTIERMIRRWED